MDKTTVMAYFSIYGDIFDTEDITHRLAILPTETKIKGVIPEGKKRASIETSWKICTKEEESLDINNQLNQLLKIINEKSKILCDIKSSLDVNFVFSFIVKIENGEKPAMHLSSDSLKLISSINAEIDIDLYIYS
ncbi:DUF4279 domain-containing protein [Providencia rettgeri]